MSKLYENYLFLKNNDKNSSNTLYLFKSGIFFIFLDDDARKASHLLNLKLTCLTDKIVKCGFPINAIEKYKKLLEQTSYNIKIIDTSTHTSYTMKNYNIEDNIHELLSKISNVNSDELSIKEAYKFIEEVKIYAQNILEKNIKEK